MSGYSSESTSTASYAAAHFSGTASSRYAVPAIASSRPSASITSVAPWFMVTARSGGASIVEVKPQLAASTG